MLDAARKATEFSRDLRRADLENDELRAAGLVKFVEIVGEAANRITREFQSVHPEIDWRDIIAMRHVLVHDYDQIELDIVWDVVTTRLPGLIAALEPLVPPWEGSA